jgi:hypothetical protein
VPTVAVAREAGVEAEGAGRRRGRVTGRCEEAAALGIQLFTPTQEGGGPLIRRLEKVG